MNVYAEVGGAEQFVDGTGEGGPPDWILMSTQRPEGENAGLYTAQADGTWAVTQETITRIWAARESAWVVAEIPIVRRQLEALEEDEAGETPDDLLPGTRVQWLGYRGKVRNWKEGAEGFPDIDQRPVRPA